MAVRSLIQSRPVPNGNVAPFQVAVVTPTVLRPTLLRTAASVFSQRFTGRGQWLIGIDQASGAREVIQQIIATRPANWTLSLFDPGYSTSVRHGGLHAARDGGALRTILSYAAHSRYVAYLDDDNWWAANHLSSLLDAIGEVDWAFSLRWFVDRETQEPLAVDEWESVGPDAGVFRQGFGGFVDPNTLMIDKLACEQVLRWWSIPLSGDAKGMSGDRQVFSILRKRHRWRSTKIASCFYALDPQDGLHAGRMTAIARTKKGRPNS